MNPGTKSLRAARCGHSAAASVLVLTVMLAGGPGAGASSSPSGTAPPPSGETTHSPAPGASPSAPIGSAVLPDLLGHWHRFGADEDDPARTLAIDRALERVSWVMRRMAMSVLQQRTVPPLEMRFLLEDGQLFQERRNATGSFERRPVQPDGQTRRDEAGNDVSWHLEPQGLRLRWAHRQARGSTLFRIERSPGPIPGANALVVDYVLEVTAISDVEPVPFRARFGRADGGPREIR